jgi:hypothetical protein
MNWLKRSIGNGLSRSAFAMVAVASLLLTTASARAACGNLSGVGLKNGVVLPMLGQAEDVSEGSASSASIVGLWHVVYTAGGEVFFESLDQWHSDGTEFENAFIPVAGGNICFGVWKTVGTRTVRLHHIGWTFDATTVAPANGTFTLDETNTVSKDGQRYTGDFTFTPYDLKGNPGASVKGKIKATRITVE